MAFGRRDSTDHGRPVILFARAALPGDPITSARISDAQAMGPGACRPSASRLSVPQKIPETIPERGWFGGMRLGRDRAIRSTMPIRRSGRSHHHVTIRLSPEEYAALCLAREHLRYTLGALGRYALEPVLSAYSSPDSRDRPRTLDRVSGFPRSVPVPRSLRYDPREYQRAFAMRQVQTKAQRALEAIESGRMRVSPETQAQYRRDAAPRRTWFVEEPKASPATARDTQGRISNAFGARQRRPGLIDPDG
jgi:hypothetical protein